VRLLFDFQLQLADLLIVVLLLLGQFSLPLTLRLIRDLLQRLQLPFQPLTLLLQGGAHQTLKRLHQFEFLLCQRFVLITLALQQGDLLLLKLLLVSLFLQFSRMFGL